MPIPSYFPEGGWNDENFRSPEGLRMLKHYLKITSRWRRSGIKRLTTLANKRFNKLLRDLIAQVEKDYEVRSGTRSAKNVRVTLDPVGDQNLWASAISDVLTEFNVGFSIDAAPIYEDTMTGVVKETTSILYGREAFKSELNRLRPKARNLASRVTNISQTTRTRLAREIQRSIDDGLTIPETVKRLRKRFPQIAKNRIPTIARTEIGRAADQATIDTLQREGVVTHVSVVGCQAIEPGIPTYRGIPTCNIQMVPVGDAGLLDFHPNHTGTIVPAKFREEVEPNIPADRPVIPPPS